MCRTRFVLWDVFSIAILAHTSTWTRKSAHYVWCLMLPTSVLFVARTSIWPGRRQVRRCETHFNSVALSLYNYIVFPPHLLVLLPFMKSETEKVWGLAADNDCNDFALYFCAFIVVYAHALLHGNFRLILRNRDLEETYNIAKLAIIMRVFQYGSGKRERQTSSRRTADRTSCNRRSKSDTINDHTHRLTRQAIWWTFGWRSWSAPSPMEETDPDHQYLMSEEEQKEERHRTRMRNMKNEEGRTECVMLNGPSWDTEKTFIEEMKAELDVCLEMKHRLRGATVDQEWKKKKSERGSILGVWLKTAKSSEIRDQMQETDTRNMKILKNPKSKQGVSAGKAPSVENSMQSVRHVNIEKKKDRQSGKGSKIPRVKKSEKGPKYPWSKQSAKDLLSSHDANSPGWDP